MIPLMKTAAIAISILLLIVGIIDCKQKRSPESSASAITSSGIPPVPDSLKQKIARYQNWRSAALADWAPGAQGIIVIHRSKETTQLYCVAKPGDSLRELTALTESVLQAYVCPDSSRKCLLFTQDSVGNENFQIHALDLTTLRQRRLTNDNAQNSDIVWSNRGDRFAYSSNRRNGKDFDIYLARIDRRGEDSLILSNGGSWSVVDWSPDDRKLLVQRYVSRTSSRLFVFDRAPGRLTPLIDSCDTVSQELGAWGADGKGVFYTSDKQTDVRCLCYFDCAAQHKTTLTRDLQWDVREISLSKDRSRLIFSTNEDGFSQLYLMDTRTFLYRKVPSLPRGIIGTLRFHPSGGMCAMTVNTAGRPEDVYALDLSTLSLLRWTKSDLGGLDPEAFVRPLLFHYPTFDSVRGKPRLIPCFLYKPRNLPPPFPVLVSIHGGPESQYWPSFRPDVQFFIDELGIAVAAPNVRGSGGYGKTYLSLDNGRRREDAVRDIGRLLDWIAKRPDLDSTRIGVTGGSYGGYMALASMVQYGDRLRAGIDLYGISNFLTFLQRTAPYRRDLRRVEYGDERDTNMRRFLIDISPVTRADRINKPLLIIQGANDARVSIEESRQMASALRKNGNIVWLLVAGDEGHGYRKKSNRDYQECVTAMFLRNFLLNK